MKQVLTTNRYIDLSAGLTYHIKLEKPKTRMATPVNRTTAAMSALKAAIKSGNIGARASGPKPCVKLTEVTADMAKAFHMDDQFCLSSVS